MEFKFLKSSPAVIPRESPSLSIPTISMTIIADDRNSDGQEEEIVHNDDDLPTQDTGESVSQLLFCHFTHGSNGSFA